MNYKFVLDSYAWVEYTIGSKMGEFVKFLLKHVTCITPTIVIAELSDKFHREKNEDDWQILYKFIKHTTTIIFLDTTLAEQSGTRKMLLRDKQQPTEKKVGLADAIIYQTALSEESQLVTGDEHFASIESVVYLKNVDLLEEVKLDILNNLSGNKAQPKP